MAIYIPTPNEPDHASQSQRPSFTKTTHTDIYDAIDPFKAELALNGKSVVIIEGRCATMNLVVAVTEAFAKSQVKDIVLIGPSGASGSVTSVITDFEEKYPNVRFFSASVNLGSPDSVKDLFKELKDTVENIDILVCNTGVSNDLGANIGDSDIDKWWNDININARGPYLLARGLIHFNPVEYPATFMVISTGINEAVAGMSGYLIGKTVPLKMVTLLDTEYPNIRSFAISPGTVPTNMFVDAVRSMSQDTSALTGGLAVYLCHPHADFLSGRFISANWDVDQIQARKEEIVSQDLLKLEIKGW